MIFDSCNMASIEVAYEFKGLVPVLVASQDLMYYSLKTTAGNIYASRSALWVGHSQSNLWRLSARKRLPLNFPDAH